MPREGYAKNATRTIDNHSHLHSTVRMVVCICHNVNDKRIADCVEEGVRTIKGLCVATRAGTKCGKCLCEARRILDEAVSAAEPALSGLTAQAVNALNAQPVPTMARS